MRVRRKRLWFALLGVGVAAVVGLVAALALRPAEPRYGGRALSQWVRRPAGDTQGDAIRQIGTNAVPFLLEWMQYERPAWKSDVYGIVNMVKKHLGISGDFDDLSFSGQMGQSGPFPRWVIKQPMLSGIWRS